MAYSVVIEKGPADYGAYVLELSGCVAAAETRRGGIRPDSRAIELYVEELKKDGLPVPVRSSSSSCGLTGFG